MLRCPSLDYNLLYNCIKSNKCDEQNINIYKLLDKISGAFIPKNLCEISFQFLATDDTIPEEYIDQGNVIHYFIKQFQE